MLSGAIKRLVAYGTETGLIPEDEKNYSHDVSFIGQMYYSDILREHVKEYSESSKKKINDRFIYFKW